MSKRIEEKRVVETDQDGMESIEGEEHEDESSLNQDIDILIKIISQEKYCPDLILYQQQIVDDLFEVLQNQEMSIKEKEKNINEDKRLQITKNKFLVDLLKEECERVKYLIKLYLRTRLSKIQTYHMNILKYNKFEYLNVQEKEFVRNYSALRQQMLGSHLLNKLPQNFRNTGIENEEQHSQSQGSKQNLEQIQIDVPNLDKAVFAKFKTSGNYDIDGEQVNVKEGDILLIPYRHIKTLHESLDVELV